MSCQMNECDMCKSYIYFKDMFSRFVFNKQTNCSYVLFTIIPLKLCIVLFWCLIAPHTYSLFHIYRNISRYWEYFECSQFFLLLKTDVSNVCSAVTGRFLMAKYS